jgi:hypothetical protein
MSWFRAARIVCLVGVFGNFMFWIRGLLDRGSVVDRLTLILLVTCVCLLLFTLALEVGEAASRKP